MSIKPWLSLSHIYLLTLKKEKKRKEKKRRKVGSKYQAFTYLLSLSLFIIYGLFLYTKK